MNVVLQTAPEFSTTAMISTPLAAVLDWSIATPAGFAFYRDARVNAAIREILNAWSSFLSGPESLYVLNDSPTGWMSEKARDVVGIEQFQHDPEALHWGFSSWNDFFTRRLAPGARPLIAAGDDRVIAAPCEATPYGLAADVQKHERFWIKDQPYSLHDMLAGDPTVDEFIGGTVYQAFLSATNYHRWHGPVSGRIERALVIAGTYYSEADSEGPAAAEPMNSQGYMAHVATRAVVIIDADDPDIGLVGFVAIGMADVSSCLIGPDITPGAHINKGDELGYFQFGGSTYCLVLRPGVVSSITLDAIPEAHAEHPPLIKVRTGLLHTSGSTALTARE